MEHKVITASSASGLNSKSEQMQKEGWKPVGEHKVVTTLEQKRFSGAQHSSTTFEHEYSITMNREVDCDF